MRTDLLISAGLAANVLSLQGNAALAASFSTAASVGYFAHALDQGQPRYYSLTENDSDSGAPSVVRIDTGNVNVAGILLPGSLVSAKADQGVLKAIARFGFYSPQAYSNSILGDLNAVASFTDTITINAGPIGQAGTAVFRLRVDGFNDNRLRATTLPTGVSYATGPQQSYFAVNGVYRFPIDGRRAVLSETDTVFDYRINFVSGQPIGIGAVLETRVLAETNGGLYTFVQSDFSHTVAWGGLASISATGGGAIVGPVTIMSASGTNYLLAVGVPEPGAWALLIVGFGLVGGIARRQRRGQTKTLARSYLRLA